LTHGGEEDTFSALVLPERTSPIRVGSSLRRDTARAALPLAAVLTLAAPPFALAADERPESAVSQVSQPALPVEASSLRYANRTIAVLRARVLSHTPAERTHAAVARLDDLVTHGVTAPVERRLLENAVAIEVGGKYAFSILPDDVDELAGETLDGKSQQAEDQLRRALDEVGEARAPERLLGKGLRALLATAVFAAAIFVLRRAHRGISSWLAAHAAAQIERRLRPVVGLVSGTHVIEAARRVIGLTSLVLGLLALYAWLAYVLREFPYTRPWGESLGGFVLGTFRHVGLRVLAAIPGLFAVALIFLLTRVLVRLAAGVFRAVELGQIALPGVHPDTSQATRRLVVAALWVFALVASYPYLPGSQTDAFKGVSVLLGLMLSLGSSGLVTQMMSSLVIIYSRSLREGEFVKVGEIEGTVLHVGVLSTKIRTLWNEEVTLPNTIVTATTTINYSRRAAEGVYARTAVTIGYDTPWRQVEALLLAAAARTQGLCAKPEPVVVQTALADYYPVYELLVALERQEDRLNVLDSLHRNIQDEFNAHGVQIMSPNYVLDPKTPKVVPKARWYEAPARRPDGA
jgi:small-conductance mechanosensitive channel